MDDFTKYDLLHLWSMIDRDFASLRAQDEADEILDKLAQHYFQMKMLDVVAENERQKGQA
jgi:hypothetical protein